MKRTSINIRLRRVFINIAIVLSVLILIVDMFFYQSFSRRDMKERVYGLNAVSSESIELDVYNIYSSFFTTFSSDAFLEDLKAIKTDSSSAGDIRYRVQSELDSFSASSLYVDTAFLVNASTGEIYQRYKDVNKLTDSFYQKLKSEDINGITWLFDDSYAFPVSGGSLFLIFPLRVDYFVEISNEEKKPDAFLVAVLRESMFFNSSGMAGHSIFIFDLNGNPIIGFGPDGDDDEVLDLAKNLRGGYEDNLRVMYGTANETRGILIVDCLDKRALLRSSLNDALLVSFGAILSILIIIIVSRRFVDQNVCKPINDLTNAVEKIKDGDYSHRVQPYFGADELGMLADSFNQMQGRILEQMEEIRLKDQAQYRTELRLFTEQLNPHFIYNSLECIRHSIVSGAPEDAEVLITSISQYLRATLAGGRDIVPISNEIKQIISYVKIMESRFAQSISLLIRGDEGLENELVLKAMLQPIVENSIKHGFNIDKESEVNVNPSIEICFSDRENMIVIEISDNGSGFDPDYVYELMTNCAGEEEGHIGLRNTYSRIMTYYGKDKAEINMSSIPYFRNTFTIIVPKIPNQVMEKDT